MITVGDYIDREFGVVMGFSTIVAAGLGQAVSDGCGVTVQSSIERLADYVGLPSPDLTPDQWKTGFVLTIVQIARTVGIVLGCLCGLMPTLLWGAGRDPDMADAMLAVVDKAARRSLLEKSHERVYRVGERVCTEGTKPDAFYEIVRGEAKVESTLPDGDVIEICSLSAGHVIGAIELTFDHDCVATVTATCDLVVRRTAPDVFFSVVDRDVAREKLTEYLTSRPEFVIYRMRHGKHLRRKLQCTDTECTSVPTPVAQAAIEQRR